MIHRIILFLFVIGYKFIFYFKPSFFLTNGVTSFDFGD